jgi:hypothetical protein
MIGINYRQSLLPIEDILELGLILQHCGVHLRRKDVVQTPGTVN